MRLLKVNNTIVDLADAQVIALTKQSNNLFDFNSKRSNLSNTLKLVKSPTNNAIFGAANDLNSTEVVRNWFEVIYIQDYDEIISSGKGKLVGCDGNYYSFVIYWGNIDLVAILGEQTIRDLNLADLIHTWNLTNVSRPSFGSHPTISGRDLNYPILNTHETEELRSGADSSNYLFAARMVPFVSLSRLLKQIQTDNGLTFEGIDEYLYPAAQDEINEHIRNDYWIPVSDRQPLFNFEQPPIINQQRNLIESVNGATNPAAIPKVLKYIDAEDIVVDEYEFINAGTYNLNFAIKQHLKSYKNGSSGIGIFVLNYLQFSTDGGATWSQTYTTSIAAYLAYIANTINNAVGTNTNIADDQYVDNLYEFDIDNEIQLTYNAAAGDLVRISTAIIQAYSGGGGMPTFLNAYHELGSSYELTKDLIVFGDEYPVQQNLPEIKQIDLLKFVAAITCSLIDVEDGTNIVRFTKFRDIVNSVTEAQDFGDNLESLQIESLQPPMSQNNYLNYDNDNELQPTYAQGNLVISNNTLPQSSELYRAPFSASLNESWDYAGLTTVQIGRYPIIKVWNEAFNAVKPRIFRLQGVGEPIYIGTSADPTNQASAKFIAYFASMQFFSEVGYLPAYTDYQNTMQDYKACNAVMKLNSSEFKNLDLYRSMYIPQLSSYFLIKIVKDFVTGLKTNVSLLKI